MFFKSVEIGPKFLARSLKVRYDIFINSPQKKVSFKKDKLIKLDCNTDPRKALGTKVYSKFVSKGILDEEQRTFNVSVFNAFLEKNLNFLSANLKLRQEEQPNSYNVIQALGRIIEKTSDNFESIYDIRLYDRKNDRIDYKRYHDSVMEAITWLMKGNVRRWNELKEIFDEAGIKINLNGMHLEGQKFSNIMLHNANLRSVDLSWSYLEYVQLTRSDLRDAILRKAFLMDVELSQARLEHADFTDAHLIRVGFVSPTLDKTFFIRTNFEFTDLSRINESGAIFQPLWP